MMVNFTCNLTGPWVAQKLITHYSVVSMREFGMKFRFEWVH